MKKWLTSPKLFQPVVSYLKPTTCSQNTVDKQDMINMEFLI